MKKGLLFFVHIFFCNTFLLAQNGNGTGGGNQWQFLGPPGIGIGVQSIHFYINSIAADNSGKFYVAGSVPGTGAVVTDNYIMEWDGTNWSEVGNSSMPYYPIGGGYSITVDDSGNVYIAGAGKYSNYNYVSKWNGTTWSVLGTGVNELISTVLPCIAVDDSGNVYASVYNDVYSNINNNYSLVYGNNYSILKWNGTTWSLLGSGKNSLNANNFINSIATDRFGNVYAAGLFTNSNGQYYIAKWDGTSWKQMGAGFNPGAYSNSNPYTVTVITDDAQNVYAAGPFLKSGNINYVARWDGTAWVEIGSGSNALNANGTIYSIAVDKRTGYIYAGGSFIDTWGYEYVAKWDGTTWSGVGVNNTGEDEFGTVIGPILVAVDCPGNVYAASIFLDVSSSANVYKWHSEDLPPVTPLVLNNDVITTSCPDNTIINELSNDTYDPNDLTGITVTDVVYGKASVLSNNQISYVPPVQFTGQDTIGYQICANISACSTACIKAKIIVNVLARDSSLIKANIDTSSILGCHTVQKNLLANDIFSDSTFITMTIIQNPNHGQYTLSGKGGISYTSAHNFEGSDTISYNICKNTCTTWCSQSLYTIQVEKPNLTIPNLITPNSDNKNDCFVVKNLSPDSRMEIYNSWGDMVFHSDSYKDDWCGDNLNDGVYYYYYKDTCYNTTDKGWVEITR